MPITDTARAILTAAADRTDHVALLPKRLSLRAGLLEEHAADEEQLGPGEQGAAGSYTVYHVAEAR